MENSKLAILGLITSITLAGCGGGDSNSSDNSGGNNNTPTTPTVALSIPFQAKSGTTEINCGATLNTLGTTGDSATVSDFAFYIHDIKFKTNAGTTVTTTLDDNSFQDPEYSVALLDFQDKTDSCKGAAKTTNKVVTLKATVDIATITGVEFTIGVPEAANHHNASISRAPYNRSGMFWSWQSGHKFMRLDVNPSKLVTKPDLTTGTTFFFHLGSTACTGDPTTGQVVSCTYPDRPTIALNSGFSVTGSTTSTIVLDYAKLVEGVNLNYETDGKPYGCMSGQADPECPVMFNNLGMTHSLSTMTSPQQQIFSVQN
ncbi:MAG: hypothetical protein RI964_2024 [Pseudomonadota bacterium]|jgi:uncharacterized repeat protein (TIGR04052 family)